MSCLGNLQLRGLLYIINWVPVLGRRLLLHPPITWAYFYLAYLTRTSIRSIMMNEVLCPHDNTLHNQSRPWKLNKTPSYHYQLGNLCVENPLHSTLARVRIDSLTAHQPRPFRRPLQRPPSRCPSSCDDSLRKQFCHIKLCLSHTWNIAILRTCNCVEPYACLYWALYHHVKKLLMRC